MWDNARHHRHLWLERVTALLILLLPNNAGEQSSAQSQPRPTQPHDLDVIFFFFFNVAKPVRPPSDERDFFLKKKEKPCGLLSQKHPGLTLYH